MKKIIVVTTSFVAGFLGIGLIGGIEVGNADPLSGGAIAILCFLYLALVSIANA